MSSRKRNRSGSSSTPAAREPPPLRTAEASTPLGPVPDLPGDILRSIFRHIENAPLIRVVALVSKRWRSAALSCITRLTWLAPPCYHPRSLSVLMPQLTRLSFCDLKPDASDKLWEATASAGEFLVWPSSLRRLDLPCSFFRGADRSTLIPTTLTTLSISFEHRVGVRVGKGVAAEARAELAVLLDVLRAVSPSLRKLDLKVTSRAVANTLSSIAELDFPVLHRLKIDASGKEANMEWYDPLLRKLSSQLTSLYLRYHFGCYTSREDGWGQWARQVPFPALRKLDLDLGLMIKLPTLRAMLSHTTCLTNLRLNGVKDGDAVTLFEEGLIPVHALREFSAGWVPHAIFRSWKYLLKCPNLGRVPDGPSSVLSSKDSEVLPELRNISALVPALIACRKSPLLRCVTHLEVRVSRLANKDDTALKIPDDFSLPEVRTLFLRIPYGHSELLPALPLYQALILAAPSLQHLILYRVDDVLAKDAKAVKAFLTWLGQLHLRRLTVCDARMATLAQQVRETMPWTQIDWDIKAF